MTAYLLLQEGETAEPDHVVLVTLLQLRLQLLVLVHEGGPHLLQRPEPLLISVKLDLSVSYVNIQKK